MGSADITTRLPVASLGRAVISGHRLLDPELVAPPRAAIGRFRQISHLRGRLGCPPAAFLYMLQADRTDAVMRRGIKIALLVAGVPFAAGAAAVIVFAIQEALAPDEYYSSSLGLSPHECEEASRNLGATPSEARDTCRRRVPKKRAAQGVQPSSTGRWALGASTMRLRADGDSRTIIYEAPSAELISAGVQAGTVFFAGKQSGKSYEGTAHRFGRGCPPKPYPVAGELSDDGLTITLRGRTPQLDANCRTVGALDRSIKLLAEGADKIAAPVPSMPADQELFTSTVETARAAYQAASTEPGRAATRPARAQRLCALLDRHDVRAWVGAFSTFTTSSDGRGILSIAIGNDIRVTTWPSAESDGRHNTLIAPGSPLYRKALTFRAGQRVSFSGTFVSSEADCIAEGNGTLRGSMLEPTFIFRFADVEPQ
jgi:hypothetical protein